MGAFVKGDAVALTAAVEPAGAVTLKKKRTRWLWAIPILVFLSVYRFAVQPRPTAYVSPPFDDAGVHFRIQLPAGWEVMHFKAFPPPGLGRAELVIGESLTGWPPRWLEKWIPRKYRPQPFMSVQVYRSPAGI